MIKKFCKTFYKQVTPRPGFRIQYNFNSQSEMRNQSLLKKYFLKENDVLQKVVVSQFNKEYMDIPAEILGQAAMNFALAKVEDELLWMNIEQQILLVADKLPFIELVRGATSLVLTGHNRGTNYFWSQFNNTIIKNLTTITPDEIIQSLMLLVQFCKSQKHDDNVYSCLEQAFITRYDEFETYNSILAYAMFGKLHRGSSIWELFETDLPGFLQEGEEQDLSLMMTGIVNMTPRFKKQTIEQIQNYVIKHGNNFLPEFKKELLESFQNHGLLKEEVAQALQI